MKNISKVVTPRRSAEPESPSLSSSATRSTPCLRAHMLSLSMSFMPAGDESNSPLSRLRQQLRPVKMSWTVRSTTGPYSYLISSPCDFGGVVLDQSDVAWLG